MKVFATRARLVLLLASLAPAFAVPAEQAGKPQILFHGEHPAMGTIFELDFYAPSQERASEVMEQAFEEIDRLEALLSNYKPSSELSRVAREAGIHSVTTDPETFQFLERSLSWSRLSGGAFDITVGPLLRAWGFFAHRGHVPTDAQLVSARTKVGWRHLQLDPATHAVRFTSGVALDLDPGSIGKGFAVDSVIRLLREQGVQAAFLSAGGSTLYGLGAPPSTDGWPVVIPDPRFPTSKGETLLLRDTSLSTGACTQKFFLKDGHRYCHIFDPRSGRPVEDMLQTTVIDPSATDSDALSTVVFVLKPEESRRLLTSLPQTRALLYRPLTDTPSCIALHWSTKVCSVDGTTEHPQIPKGD